MFYKDEYHPRVKSDLKKLDKSVVRELYEVHVDKILLKPHSGEKLHGDLEGISSYHFRKNKVDYRIAYSVEEENSLLCDDCEKRKFL